MLVAVRARSTGWIALLAVLGVLLAGLVAGAGPAAAAAAFPRIDASTVDSYRLTPGSVADTYGKRIAALERNAQLAPRGVADVLASANRTARPLCHATYLASALNPKGFCWQDGEDDDENVWIPQGVSGSGDANPATGTVGGRRVVVADWHDGNDDFIRVSFVDITDPNRMTYRHVLLVEPSSDTTFKAVAGHGHGLAWSGNLLFVATSGSLIRVFDVRHLWAVDTSTAQVGLGSDGKYHARYHAFALPQVNAYWYPGGVGCASLTGAHPCLSSLAVDHTGDGSLITVEHSAKGGGRVVRWPMDPGTGLLKVSSDQLVHAVEGFTSPVWGMQGAVARDGYFVITGVCPEYAGQTGVDRPSCLHGGVGGVSTFRLAGQAPVNSQNLSYWPATGELWLISEQLRERVTVRVPFNTLTGTA
ncbi:hypothetical protein LX83_003366 [Goodfellowiella coeruleoviolacea]|uniref:Secreted protein n=1 Tax=Goodfellowiella coeruleoviolacea TaxID=334858 RepID=A0AAE3GI01_9PSEU|nr:hypothetical protein [Goodfellowiella coeruleoviolacea]